MCSQRSEHPCLWQHYGRGPRPGDKQCPVTEDGVKKAGTCVLRNTTQPLEGDILPLVTPWMGLETTTLSELSQTEEAKNHMIPLVCGI